MSRTVIITLVLLLVVLTQISGCKLSGSKINYFNYPFTRKINGNDQLCIHVNSSHNILKCAGGCSGYFSHNLVYTLRNEGLVYLANRSCSGENMHCCTAFTKVTISVELTFACIDRRQLKETDLFTEMVIASFLYIYVPEEFNQRYNHQILSVVVNHETATSCGCAACYGPHGVSETVCYKLAQGH